MVEDYVVQIKLMTTAVGCWLIQMLGGWDSALEFLFYAMCLNVVTGMWAAVRNHEQITFDKAFDGATKYAFILFLVSLAHMLDAQAGLHIVGEAVAIFYAVSMVVSILQNAKEVGVAIPDILKDAAMQIYKRYVPNAVSGPEEPVQK